MSGHRYGGRRVVPTPIVRIASVLVMLGAIAALVGVPTASAHHTDNMFKTANYGTNCSTSTYCQSDNSSLTFFREASLTTTAKSNIWSVVFGKYDPTDLSASHESPPVYTGASETDLVYQVDGSIYPSQARTVCDDPIDGTKCDQFYVKFGNDFWSEQIVIACHETGHGVGFVHGQFASPIKSNTDPSLECSADGSGASYVVGTHMVPLINSTY